MISRIWNGCLWRIDAEVRRTVLIGKLTPDASLFRLSYEYTDSMAIGMTSGRVIEPVFLILRSGAKQIGQV